jgi:hypothetical protein
VLGERDVLAPVAGIGQPIMRAAPVHPFLALAGVMVREGKVRRSIAQRLAYRDALSVERIGYAGSLAESPPCECPSARNAGAARDS